MKTFNEIKSRYAGFNVKGIRPDVPAVIHTLSVNNECFGAKHIKKELMGSKDKPVKPILRPLTDLIVEIEHEGRKFTPLIELFNMVDHLNYVEFNGQLTQPKLQIDDEWNHCISFEPDPENYMCFAFDSSTNSFTMMLDCEYTAVTPQLEMFFKLHEWHFDLYDLIKNGEALNINTLNE